MPTARPFAYNPGGSPIDGTEQIGDLAVGTPPNGFESTGIRWWNGPDESLGYIIAHPSPGYTQPTPDEENAGVGFWRSDDLTDDSFLTLANSIRPRRGSEPFTSAMDAKAWLNSNGYWTSWNVQSGSLYFASGAYLTIPGSSDWAVGTEDFTVEWFQYQTQPSPPPYSRIFQVGVWPSVSIGVSIENGVFLLWTSGTSSFTNVGPLSNYLNRWVHFAVVRKENVLSVYQAGNRIYYGLDVNNISNSTDVLAIGADSGYSYSSYWNGYLTNFRFVNGYSVYDPDSPYITVPTSPLDVVPGTKLLLSVSTEGTYITDSSGMDHTVSNIGGVLFSATGPFS